LPEGVCPLTFVFFLPGTDIAWCSTSSGDLCVIDSVKQAGQILGQPASAEAIFAALFGDKSALDTLLDDAKAGCTPCAKAAYTIAESDFPSLIDQGKDAVQSVCGADFVGEYSQQMIIRIRADDRCRRSIPVEHSAYGR
jgi:hypothetical protein